VTPRAETAWLDWLDETPERPPGPPTLLVVAHPDDETACAGALLANLPTVWIAVLTDGAPRDPVFASAAGAASRADYVKQRRAELEQAVALAGIGADRVFWMGAVDQEAALELPRLVQELVALVKQLDPELVLTQAYEGGHPDHDAAALVAQYALRLLARGRGPRLPLLEMPSYHETDAGFVVGAFLPGHSRIATVLLDEAGRHRKTTMFECYRSQRDVLARVPLVAERFRPALPCDFGHPPHAGRLHYERLGWPLRGADFREQARSVGRELGL
jgi:LmbE family N-acetylglucosaminyl deacetylase